MLLKDTFSEEGRLVIEKTMHFRWGVPLLMGGLVVSLALYGTDGSSPFFEWIYTTYVSLFFIPFTFMGECYDEVTVNEKKNPIVPQISGINQFFT